MTLDVVTDVLSDLHCAGFVNGVTPGNLGISFNINI